MISHHGASSRNLACLFCQQIMTVVVSSIAGNKFAPDALALAWRRRRLPKYLSYCLKRV